MKKVLSVLVLCLLLGLNLSAQRSIEELNGYDWVGMSAEAKVSTIRGFYLACTMICYMFYEQARANGANDAALDDLATRLDNQFTYSEGTVDMAKKLDSYYASPSKREFTIYRTIPFMAGKEWWNRETGEVERTSSSYKSGT